MRITKEEVVAGHSALRVRGFLRRFKRGFFMLSAVERFMQLKSRQAAEFINDMVVLELIEPTIPFGNEAAFQVATRGHAFANATAAKPIYRGTAERVLREFMDRVNAVNASKEYAFKVKSAVLFGSLLFGPLVRYRPEHIDGWIAELPTGGNGRRFPVSSSGRNKLAVSA